MITLVGEARGPGPGAAMEVIERNARTNVKGLVRRMLVVVIDIDADIRTVLHASTLDFIVPSTTVWFLNNVNKRGRLMVIIIAVQAVLYSAQP
jgi:hypothetical protein